MIFRQATEQDIPAIASVIEDGRAALAAAGLDQWQGPYPNADDVRADVAAGCAYVAADDTGKVMGTLAFVDSGEPDYENAIDGAWLLDVPNAVASAAARECAPSERRAPYVALHRVAVSAAAQGQGVASFMLKSACDLARSQGFASVRADTHEDNAAMQRTLEKAGFRRCCTICLSSPLEPTKERIGFELVL